MVVCDPQEDFGWASIERRQVCCPWYLLPKPGSDLPRHGETSGRTEQRNVPSSSLQNLQSWDSGVLIPLFRSLHPQPFQIDAALSLSGPLRACRRR